MKNLTIGKLALGVLMMFVLALGVQSVADALTFGTSKTGDLQTVVENNEFTISFSVSPGSNTTRITDDDGKLIKDNTADGGAANARIDSSGYLVTEIGTREYRNITTNPTGTLVVDPRPTYNDETPSAAGSPTAPYYVDSSRNVVDANGDAVYVQTGGGDRAGSDPWRYTRAKADPTDKVPDANRYHFNQEAISISVPTGMTLIRVGSYAVNVVGDETAAHTMDEARNSMNEDKLSSSIRLTYRVTASEDYTIVITDTTPPADRPGSESPPLSFTIYGVPSYDGTTALALTGAGADGFETRNDHADPQVNTLFSVGDVENVPLIYSVEGSGRLYIKETYTNGAPTSQGNAANTLSTSSAAMVYLDMNGSTNKVTAYVRDQNAAATSKTIIFIFNYAAIEIISGNDQTGVPDSRLINPLGVRVKDAKGRPISGLPVTFDPDGGATLKPVIGTDVYLTTANAWASTFATIARTRQATATVPASIGDDTDDENDTALVPTDRSGEAQVYLEVGDAGSKTVAVSAGGDTGRVRFDLTSSASTDIPSLEIFSGNNQRSDSNGRVANLLIVRVLASNNQPLPNQLVTFTTTKGFLTTPSAYQDNDNAVERLRTINGPLTQVTARTDINGKAGVSYDLVNHEGAADVIAEIKSEATSTSPYQRRVTFNINGTGSSGTGTGTTGSPYLSLSTRSLTGSPGQQRSFTVTAYDGDNQRQNINVNLSSSGVTVPSSVRSGQSVPITIPSSPTSISVSAPGYSSQSITVTVESVAGNIVKVSGDSPVQTGEPGRQLSSAFVVRVDDRNNNPLPRQTVTFRVTSGGGNFSGSTSTTATTDSSGQASVTLTLGSAAGTNTVTASVGTLSPVTFTATARTLITRLELDGGNNQNGEINSALSQPLVVRITDQDGNGIPGQSVTFSTVEGSGRFSPIRPQIRTDRDGYASVSFTPRSAGTIKVEAASGDLDPVTFTITTGPPPDALVMVSGNNQSGRPGARLANPFVVEVIDTNDDPVSGVTVSFRVTAGGGSVSPESATTNNSGRAQTRLTLGDEIGENTVTARVSGVSRAVTFTATSGSQVLVSAAQRPPMYWVSRTTGKLHRLVGEEVENLAPTVEGVTAIAVDTTNNILYFAVQRGENRGAIQRANLNGRNVETLKTLTAVPRGIAVDAAGGIVYWTNSRGRIQSMATEGSAKLTNHHQNLANPSAIILSNGFLYWAEPLGRIRRVSLTAQEATIQNIATGLGDPLSLSIAKGKIYWVERNASGGGSLQRSNLDGSGIQQLKTFASGAPVALAVDSSDNKIYWTKGAGKIQRANLAGRFVKDVVTGIMNPGAIALGVAAVPSTPRQPANNQQQDNQEQDNQQPTTYSVYDINKDGAVNNADTRAVAADVGNSGTAIKNKRADVDGSGTVDVTDLILVLGNLDDDVAAPAIDVDVKALDVDFDRVQEQVEVLLASGDRSIAAQRALLYLQHLLASARPDETVLLANYPNPFNPETWIPYHLSESTDVRVNIYDAQGTLVRELTLGHQTAGYYTSRSRAAYWDGKNALGERVASGIYFYQLQTDEMSPLRKMVILK